MERYIKEVLKEFGKNLKKTWFFGVVCIVIAFVFVFVSAIVGTNDKSDITTENIQFAGTESFLKFEWAFEKQEISQAYEVQVNTAREGLYVLIGIANTGDFKEEINEELKKVKMEPLEEDDAYYFAVVSYNVLKMETYGVDSEKVEYVEKIVREKITALAKNTYAIEAVDCISEPCIMMAEKVTGGYRLSNTPYDDMIEKDDDSVDNDMNYMDRVLSLSNIVIVLSSIVLYGVIIFLITIAKSKENV